MSPVQRAALEAIKRLTVDDISPSYREIADALNISSVGRVHKIVHELFRDGFIEIRGDARRAIRVVADRQAYTDIELAKLSVEELQRLSRAVYAALLAKTALAA